MIYYSTILLYEILRLEGNLKIRYLLFINFEIFEAKS